MAPFSFVKKGNARRSRFTASPPLRLTRGIRPCHLPRFFAPQPTTPLIISAAISARNSSASSEENALPSSSGCTPRVNASANAHMKTPQDELSCCWGSNPGRVPVPSGFRRHGLRLGAIGCLSAHSSAKYCCKIVRTSVANRGLPLCPSLVTPAPLLFESKYNSAPLLTAATRFALASPSRPSSEPLRPEFPRFRAAPIRATAKHQCTLSMLMGKMMSCLLKRSTRRVHVRT